MSAIHTWACFLLWIGFATQDKTPDVKVTCFVSEECVLPCSFTPGTKETVEWYRQSTLVYTFKREDADANNASEDNDGEEEDGGDHDDDDGDDSDSSEEQVVRRPLDGRASVFPHLISRGNATLILRQGNLKDRGTYRCNVRTAEGEHQAKVILKMEAPIRGLSLELSRLSGYEEMRCTIRNVFPAPRVTWATEPPTFEDLRPITRMLADSRGLYTVDSRLKPLNGRPELIYICKVTTPYGGPTWTSSLRENVLRGSNGKDLTIPCHAPPYLNNPTLSWTFNDGEDPAHILTYDSKSGHSASSPSWQSHVELDGFRVPFGDGSLRLMNPQHAQHTGCYSCTFSMPYNTHTERSDVTIETTGVERATSEGPSYWWIVGLVVAVLVLALAAMLACLKMRANNTKPQNDPEEVTELHSVKDSAAEGHTNESSPLNAGGTNGQTAPHAGSQLT